MSTKEQALKEQTISISSLETSVPSYSDGLILRDVARPPLRAKDFLSRKGQTSVTQWFLLPATNEKMGQLSR
jgi:hypothetical protein